MSAHLDRHIPLGPEDTKTLLELRLECLDLADRFVNAQWKLVSGSSLVEADVAAVDPEALLVFAARTGCGSELAESGDLRLINLGRFRRLSSVTPIEPSRSCLPAIDLAAPASLAFRLRTILGVTVRAELVRVMLGSADHPLTVHRLAEGVLSSSRQVKRVLYDLQSAGLVFGHWTDPDSRFQIESHPWSSLLGLRVGNYPTYFPWPTYLPACATIIEWLRDLPGQAGSGAELYIHADLMLEQLRKPLLAATSGEQLFPPFSWTQFAEFIRVCLGQLEDQEFSEGARSAKEGPLRGGKRSIGSGASE